MNNNKPLEHLLRHISVDFLMEADRMTSGLLLDATPIQEAQGVLLNHYPIFDAAADYAILDPNRPHLPPRKLNVVVLDHYDDIDVLCEDMEMRYQICPYVQIDCDGEGRVSSWKVLPEDGGSDELGPAVAVISCAGTYHALLIAQVIL